MQGQKKHPNPQSLYLQVFPVLYTLLPLVKGVPVYDRPLISANERYDLYHQEDVLLSPVWCWACCGQLIWFGRGSFSWAVAGAPTPEQRSAWAHSSNTGTVPTQRPLVAGL